MSANNNILHVPTDYPTIQQAINEAKSGDIIFVHKGTYYENIVINKSVALIGENVDLTVIDGNGSGSVITITADNVTVRGFTIRNSGTNVLKGDSGVRIGLCARVVIEYNKIMNNVNGIGLYTAISNIISSNIISDNREGIVLYTSSGNMIINNTILNSTFEGLGFYLSSDNNTISSNTILNNGKGIMIFSSADNLIYHNNFINNTLDAEIVQADSAKNTWSYEGEGNYWNRYSGLDINEDGIGDSPYDINEEATDPHPLMGMFSGFKIVLKGEEYNIDVICNSSILDHALWIGETGSIILHFEVATENFAPGFIRVKAPAELMNNPLIVLIDNVEAEPKILNVSDTDYLSLYITYPWGEHTIKIISSTVLGLYHEIEELKSELLTLNSKLSALNSSYQDLLEEYSLLLANYSEFYSEEKELRWKLSILNASYENLLNKYDALQQNYTELSATYQKHLSDYSENLKNIQSLVYILMTSTAAFLVTTVYLSRQARISAGNVNRRSKKVKN